MEFKKDDRTFYKYLSIPFIYAMILPAVILDVFLEIFQNICFRLYGIELVKRSNHIKIDRQKLAYLSLLEKFNCMYCGYVNGLFHYATEIGARTEQYWCAIKHQKGQGFVEPKHHKTFLIYGDEQSFKEKYSN
mgnify:FL=1